MVILWYLVIFISHLATVHCLCFYLFQNLKSPVFFQVYGNAVCMIQIVWSEGIGLFCCLNAKGMSFLFWNFFSIFYLLVLIYFHLFFLLFSILTFSFLHICRLPFLLMILLILMFLFPIAFFFTDSAFLFFLFPLLLLHTLLFPDVIYIPLSSFPTCIVYFLSISFILLFRNLVLFCLFLDNVNVSCPELQIITVIFNSMQA